MSADHFERRERGFATSRIMCTPIYALHRIEAIQEESLQHLFQLPQLNYTSSFPSLAAHPTSPNHQQKKYVTADHQSHLQARFNLNR